MMTSLHVVELKYIINEIHAFNMLSTSLMSEFTPSYFNFFWK